MFILDIIPTWVFVVVLFLGIMLFVVSQLTSKFPFIGKYADAALYCSLPVVIASSMLLGASGTQNYWNDIKDEAETKMVILEKDQIETNLKIVTQYIDKPVEVIVERTNTIIQKIPQIITKEVDQECKIPIQVIDLHNEAALVPEELF